MPAQPTSSPAGDPHQARGLAESFGGDAAAYHRGRPGYPRALTDRILDAVGGRDVLDVGIGTGISSEGFRARGCRVLGVDVDPRMADFAKGHGLDVEAAKLEDWDPRGRTFDLVVAGQAWHWIDPLAGAAKAAAVLREGGRLAALWNAFQMPTELAEAVRPVYERVLGDAPIWRGMFAGPDAYTPIFDRTAEASAEPAGSARSSSGASTGPRPTRGTAGWRSHQPPEGSTSCPPASCPSSSTASVPPSTGSVAASR